MAIPKFFAFSALALISIIFIGFYFLSEKASVNNAEQVQPELNLQESKSKIDTSVFSLFTDSTICKAITNAATGTNPEIMKTSSLENKIIISFEREADGKELTYDCKKIDDRFYWESSSKFLSQSIIEVEARVTAPRIDELTLYIFDTSDRGNIVKSYTIDEFE